MFGRNWLPAQATIVTTRDVESSGIGLGISQAFVAEVRPPEGAPFRATLLTPVIATNFHGPESGATVKVLVHRKTRRVKFDPSDPSIRANAQRPDGKILREIEP